MAPPIPAQAFPTPEPHIQENRTKILVVDDEENVRQLLRDILETGDYQVSLAAGGREALALFDANKFDGVFTDIGMPGMNGWELAQAIRQRDQQIPLAVITGWGDAVGSDKQHEAEVDWVVTKPFNADRILELAREVSKRREPGATFIGTPHKVDAVLTV